MPRQQDPIGIVLNVNTLFQINVFIFIEFYVLHPSFLCKPLYCVLWLFSTLGIFGINKKSIYIRKLLYT